MKFIPVTEGDDIDLNDNERLAYHHIENLGHGHSAIVEKIQDMDTGVFLARKTFRLHRHQERQRQTFRNEIAIIRRLAANQHVIRIFATFTSKQEVGIILHPVADGGDLKSFLNDCKGVSQLSTAQSTIIRTGFGCLSIGLAFIHMQGIRHKDIKPSNVLIHQEKMLYTDFGYSLQHDIGNSTTSGRPGFFTTMYCAPEVIQHEPRNSKSDIFSLGCVLLELLAVYDDPDLVTGSFEPYFERIEPIQRKLTTPGASTDYQWLRNIVSNMLDASANVRPQAEYVVTQIREKDQEYFCQTCTRVHSSISANTIPSQDPVKPLDVSANSRGWNSVLDHTYRTRTRSEAREFFIVGRIFSILSSEPADSVMAARHGTVNTNITIGRFGENIFCQIRKFIIVKVRRGFVEAVGIFTYGNMATLKPGCYAAEHAPAYSLGEEPTIYEGEEEKGMVKSPIEVVPATPDDVLPPASRIRFGRTYPVDYNVKAKDLGMVSPRDIDNLLHHWRYENRSDDYDVPQDWVSPREQRDSTWHNDAMSALPDGPPYLGMHDSQLFQERQPMSGRYTHDTTSPGDTELSSFSPQQHPRLPPNGQYENERQPSEFFPNVPSSSGYDPYVNWFA